MAAKKLPTFDLPKLIVDCAHEGCRTPAKIKQKVPTGWANFCEYHYKEFHSAEAEKRNQERGLFTTEQRIEFCRSLFPGLVKHMTREPGEEG